MIECQSTNQGSAAIVNVLYHICKNEYDADYTRSTHVKNKQISEKATFTNSFIRQR